MKGISWSRDGRTLVSVASDGQIVLWDVLTGGNKASVTLPHDDVKGISMNQKPPFVALVSYESPEHQPSLVDLESASCKSLSSSSASSEIDAVMSKDGKDIFMSYGTQLSKMDGTSLNVVESVITASPIRKISISQKSLIVSCYDGGLYLYSTGDLSSTPKGPFLHSNIDDPGVEVTRWNDFCLTQDGGYLAAVPNLTSLKRPVGEHLVYFWSLASCELERVLEGLDEKDKRNAVKVVAHPVLPVVVTASDSASSSSFVYVWAKIQVENWSAFAPDFEELQENKLYIESEDEFDWNTDGNMSTKIELMERRKVTLAAEVEADAIVVDVFTMGDIGGVLPSDDEEDDVALHYLPVVIQPDLVQEEEKPAVQITEEDPHEKMVRDIHEAEVAHDLALDEEEEEEGITGRRRTRSRVNSRVNSRAASPSEAQDDGGQLQGKKRPRI